MSFAQPKLPYEESALEPHISTETLKFHYGKHHLTYWNNLNNLTKGQSEYEGKSLTDLIKSTSGGLFNQAAQTFNHSFYWSSMKPNPHGEPNAPTGKVAQMIVDSFGSFDEFKKQFSAAAGGHFGSGWVWLVLNTEQKLEIVQTHDADCPLRRGEAKPILTCDVWEHAYYIDYRNARPEYVKAWWALVNWDFANENLKAAGLA